MTFTSEEEHNNPSCNAYILARNVDPKSSFGDFIAIYGIIDKITAKRILSEYSDGIIAKGYTQEALDILKKKKRGMFVILKGDSKYFNTNNEMKQFSNIALTQPANNAVITDDMIYNSIYTRNKLINENIVEDLLIANISLKYAQSNSVAFAKDGTLLGIGVGQQSRIDCVKLAGEKALVNTLRTKNNNVRRLIESFKDTVKRNEKINAIIKYIENDFTENEYNEWCKLFHLNFVPPILNDEIKDYTRSKMSCISMASDAFFPFRDNIDLANKYGVKYLIQPGGSIKDAEILDACDDYNMIMSITNRRMFLH